jgi:hypothetical protein
MRENEIHSQELLVGIKGKHMLLLLLKDATNKVSSEMMRKSD